MNAFDFLGSGAFQTLVSARVALGAPASSIAGLPVFCSDPAPKTAPDPALLHGGGKTVADPRHDRGMCIMCNGASLDEVRFDLHGRIERHGWAVQYVAEESIGRSWAYTIGLAAGFDHPELVVVGLEPEPAGGLLNVLGDMIRDGTRFDAGHLTRVHPAHFVRGVFASWVDYYGALGRRPAAKALEVVPPGRTPKLDRASSPIGKPPRRRPSRRRPRGR